MDPNARWWTNEEIDWQINAWQNELQQEMELVWGTSSQVLSSSTITLTSLTPEPLRVDSVYLNNFRLSGRTLHDRDVLYNDWRTADAATPRMVVMPDSQRLVLWPPLATSGTLVLEYPKKLSFTSDQTQISLPEWTQYTAKHYVCAKMYLRPGPTNDRNKAARYWKLFTEGVKRVKSIWAEFFPERYRKLKPGGRYEADILNPPTAWDITEATMANPSFEDYIPTGTIDGSNLTFTIPVTPTEAQVFKNGQCMVNGSDYTISGYTITFETWSVPQTGDVLVVWVFRV
jgi:hypothetical protein